MNNASIRMVEQYDSITAVILAGGASRRMGRNKAHLILGDRLFIQIISENLRHCFRHIFISAGTADAYPTLGFPVIVDIYKGCGPIGGIHAALTCAETDWVFIIPCDIPFFSHTIVSELMEECRQTQAVVPVHSNMVHPLCAFYHTSCLDIVEWRIRNGKLSVREMLRNIHTRYVPIKKENAFRLVNINTPEDYSRVLENFSTLSIAIPE
jgi:molybdenum cofactor guanylyltransferase